jgi:SPFH domain / Band 7 family.
MAFFRNEFANVVEWEEFRDDMIFWKWKNREIKRGSKLILRPGQDAIFLYNGRIEGIFQEEGEYEIESEIIPFLSTLKGFKFGFNSGLRVEVLFVNTKEFTVKWGTKNPILIPTPGYPGGMPIRANGTFQFKVVDYPALIEKIAGIKQQYFVEDVKLRIISVLDQLLMKWISKEGKDMFNLQANAFDIAEGIREDLDKQMRGQGLSITGFQVMSFNYPKEVQDMITKYASYGMVGDISRYQQIAMTEAMAQGKTQGGSAAADMAGMMMGMNIAKEMLENMKKDGKEGPGADSKEKKGPNFCPNCGEKVEGAKFCPNCGKRLI